MGPGVRIRYAASDKKRQTIPWVEYTASRRHANLPRRGHEARFGKLSADV